MQCFLFHFSRLRGRCFYARTRALKTNYTVAARWQKCESEWCCGRSLLFICICTASRNRVLYIIWYFLLMLSGYRLFLYIKYICTIRSTLGLAKSQYIWMRASGRKKAVIYTHAGLSEKASGLEARINAPLLLSTLFYTLFWAMWTNHKVYSINVFYFDLQEPHNLRSFLFAFWGRLHQLPEILLFFGNVVKN